MWLSSPDRHPRQRRLWERWERLPVVLRDGIGGILLLALSLLPLGVAGVELGELHQRVAWWLPPILVAGQTLGLALRRMTPAAGLGVVGAAFSVAQLSGASTGLAGLGLFVAIYSFAAYQPRLRRSLSVAAAAGYLLLTLGLHAAGSPERLIDWATFFLVLTSPWLVGLLVRRRAAEQIDREAKAAEAAVRESRSHLARDLHDIVTHHVTAMVVQAESAAYLDESDAAERAETLETIGATGRRALQELRSLLGALEQTAVLPGGVQGASAGVQGGALASRDAVPQTVADLVEEARQRGYPVTLDQPEPRRPFSDEVEVTLYRIAQEALTNAMKHSPGAAVAINLTESGGQVRLRVVNDIGQQDPGLPGRGRRNMADRAALLGGSFEADGSAGRFTVITSFAADARTRSEADG